MRVLINRLDDCYLRSNSFLSCQLKLPTMKSTEFKHGVEILAFSLGWLLAENGVRCALVRKCSLDLEMMSDSAGLDFKSSWFGLSPSFDCQRKTLDLEVPYVFLILSTKGLTAIFLKSDMVQTAA